MKRRCVFGAMCVLALAGCASHEPTILPLAAPTPTRSEPVQEALMGAPEPPPEPTKPVPTTPEQNLANYQACRLAFNAKDFEAYANCFGKGQTSELVDSGFSASSGSALQDDTKAFTDAFEDLVAEPQLTLVTANSLAGISLLRGTPRGGLPSARGESLPARGVQVGMLLGEVVELQEGQPARAFQYGDRRSLLGKLVASAGPKRNAAKVTEALATHKPVIVVAGGSETEARNLALYGQYIEAFNQHDAQKLDAFLATDVVLSEQLAKADFVGNKATKKALQELWKGVSDLKLHTESAWAAGDYVVSRTSASGTNDGPLPMLELWKPTRRPIFWSRLEIGEFRDGKLRRLWVFQNGAALVTQLRLRDAPNAQPIEQMPKPAAPPAGVARDLAK